MYVGVFGNRYAGSEYKRLEGRGDDSCFLTCLWVWGRDIKSGARKYSAKPKKIAKLA